jgi:uncharacterized protein DUF2586
MTIPSVNFTVLDNGLAQGAPGNGNVMVVIGCGSGGTSPVATAVQSATNGAFIAAGGYGPGPQLAELILAETGNEVVFVQAGTVTAGSNSNVFAAKQNTSASVMTITGTPYDTYYGLVTVAVGGTVGTTGIQLTVSLDAGRGTYQTVNLGVATTYAIPNTGLTLNFTSATLVAGDQFYWVSTEPQWSDASVASAIQALYAIPFGETFIDIHITGGGNNANGQGQGAVGVGGGDVTSFDAQATSLFTKRRFCRVLTQARDAIWGGASSETEAAWIASIEADHVNDSSLRAGVTAGHYNITSPVDQIQYRRPLLWDLAVRDSAIAIQLDLGEVDLGALAPLVVPSRVTWPQNTPGKGPNADGFLYHDESATPGLDAARFATALQYIGFPGFYCTAPNLMAPPGSDFNLLEHGHVIDAACLVWYLFATQRLRSGVRVNPPGSTNAGTILEQDRQTIQNAGTQALQNVLTPGKVVSAVYCTISNQDNILSTSTLTTTVTVIPLGLIVKINTTITFLNPFAGG